MQNGGKTIKKYGLWETYNVGQDEERIRNAVCPECGSREIVEGDLQAREGLAFVPTVQDRVIPRGCGRWPAGNAGRCSGFI